MISEWMYSIVCCRSILCSARLGRSHCICSTSPIVSSSGECCASQTQLKLLTGIASQSQASKCTCAILRIIQKITTNLILLLRLFPTRWGSAAQILDFQNVLSWASAGVTRSSSISLWTQSIHLPLGFPLGLFPGTIISTIALTSLFSSILCMCPYQCSLISLTFSLMLFTPSSFLMSTLFTLSLSVTHYTTNLIEIP